MASLFIVGNTNEHNFANAALAAHTRNLAIKGEGVTDVFVLHSPESNKYLAALDDWKDHLRHHGLEPNYFSGCVADFSQADSNDFENIASRIEKFLLGIDVQKDVYVDLTNGNSLYKSILSNIAYLLGVKRLFIVDSPKRKVYLEPEELTQAYLELPDPSLLDSVAPAWLTEIRRYNLSAQQASETFRSICGNEQASIAGFEGDIKNAVHNWFQGEKKEDGAALGGAVRHVGRAFEDLIRGVYFKFTDGKVQAKDLNDMIGKLCSSLSETAPEYEPRLIEDVSHMLRRLRNASTHQQTSADFGRIRARLSTELLLATTEYFKILHQKKLITSNESDSHEKRCVIRGDEGQVFYFGIDGDDTGKALEMLFQREKDESVFTAFSNSIDEAISKVVGIALAPPMEANILFQSGDDVLLKGNYHESTLKKLKTAYSDVSGGHTCSIGYGRTPVEAYIALKMAKANPGKDHIQGIQLVEE